METHHAKWRREVLRLHTFVHRINKIFHPQLDETKFRSAELLEFDHNQASFTCKRENLLKEETMQEQSQDFEYHSDHPLSQEHLAAKSKNDATTLDRTTALSDASSFTVDDIDEENPSTSAGPAAMNEEMPMEKSEPSTETNHMNALLKNRKFQAITILVVVVILVAVIVPVVLVTQNGSKATTSSSPNPAPTPQLVDTDTASTEFLEKLKPLLSNDSLDALLNDIDSPQSQSLKWLLERSNFQEWPFHRQVQRYAMATIYYAMGGPLWIYRHNWLSNETECQWFQRGSKEKNFCDDGTTSLLFLNQSANALNGKIPDEIGLLSSLTILDLSQNRITGTLSTAFSSLTALTTLSLNNNLMTGTVPRELFSLSTLKSLRLYSNKFSGTMPTELGLLTELRILIHTSFNGTVPSELGSMTLLTTLSLYGSSLTGTLPSELGALTALTYLDLSGHSFYGTLPTELGTSLIASTQLGLSYGSVTGTMPTGSVTGLSRVSQGGNSFHGSLPSELGSLTVLEYLDLYNNSLTGTVPSELGSLTSLTKLSLGVNAFQGSVPSEFGALVALAYLGLNNNSFLGSLPSELASWTSLEYLDLSGTSLTGTVPAKVCNRTHVLEIHVDCDASPPCSCCVCSSN